MANLADSGRIICRDACGLLRKSHETVSLSWKAANDAFTTVSEVVRFKVVKVAGVRRTAIRSSFRSGERFSELLVVQEVLLHVARACIDVCMHGGYKAEMRFRSHLVRVVNLAEVCSMRLTCQM